MVEPGRRCLGDRYELHQTIAAGGMGQVWRGLDTALQRPVAVKVLRSEYTGDPSFLARFRAEAQHAASLSHPNVAAVFDYGEETAQDGTGETLAYLVMELVDGEPLSALLAREGALDAETTLQLLQQTAFALAEAHRMGLVHRDVKPGNILVRADGSVKITDFGIAWSARSVALTRTGQVIGTPQYLSPEQAEGRLATPASDVYALGLIGYECLTGHPAFDGDNAVTIALKQVQQQPAPLPGELPRGVRTLITWALVKDPAARIPDGAAFGAAIDDVLEGRVLPEPPTPPTQAVAAVGAAGDPGTGATVFGPPPPRRAGRLVMAFLPLVALLAGAGIAAGVLQTLSDGAPAATAQAAEQRETTSILLTAADHVGRPVDEVAAELAALGLVVERRAEPSSVAPRDTVTGLSPTGRQLRAGDVVVLRYAVAAPRTAVPGGDGVGSGGARVTGPSPAPAAPSDTGGAPPTSAAAESLPPTSSSASPTGSPAESTTAAPTTPGPTNAPTTTAGTSDPSATATSQPPASSTSPSNPAGSTTPTTQAGTVTSP